MFSKLKAQLFFSKSKKAQCFKVGKPRGRIAQEIIERWDYAYARFCITSAIPYIAGNWDECESDGFCIRVRYSRGLFFFHYGDPDFDMDSNGFWGYAYLSDCSPESVEEAIRDLRESLLNAVIE